MRYSDIDKFENLNWNVHVDQIWITCTIDAFTLTVNLLPSIEGYKWRISSWEKSKQDSLKQLSGYSISVFSAMSYAFRIISHCENI